MAVSDRSHLRRRQDDARNLLSLLTQGPEFGRSLDKNIWRLSVLYLVRFIGLDARVSG